MVKKLNKVVKRQFEIPPFGRCTLLHCEGSWETKNEKLCSCWGSNSQPLYFWNSHASYCATKLVIHAYVCQEWQALLPVRLELMAFIMWDWRTTYCAMAACRPHKMIAISLSFFLKKCWLWWPHSCHFCRMKNMDNYCILHIFFSSKYVNLSVKNKKLCSRWGSNSRPSDYETDALPTALRKLVDVTKWQHFAQLFSLQEMLTKMAS